MRINSARLLDSASHQKRRPVHSMKTQNVLAHQMQRRPVLLKPERSFLLFIAKSNRGDVVRERVEPHVHRMTWIVGYRHTPTDRSLQTADGEILQPTAHKTNNFIAPRFGPDKISRLI